MDSTCASSYGNRISQVHLPLRIKNYKLRNICFVQQYLIPSTTRCFAIINIIIMLKSSFSCYRASSQNIVCANISRFMYVLSRDRTVQVATWT